MTQHGNDLQRQRRIQDHAEHGWRPCRACGVPFLPPYGPAWSSKQYCPDPDCQAIKSDRAKESRYAYAARSREQGLTSKHRDRGKQWKCRVCGRMSDNRLDCPECKAHILARNDTWLDCPVDTIDIANMGLIPY